MKILSLLFLCVPASVSALCVNEETANLRKGPDTKYEKTFEAIRYMPLEKISKQNGWYRVKVLDGSIHWVKENLVTDSFRCATIKEEFANLRQGPGTNWPKIHGGRGDRFLSFRLLKEQGKWVRLEDIEGDVVWIAKENLWIP